MYRVARGARSGFKRLIGMTKRDWRQIRVNDPVKEVRSQITGEMIWAFTSLSTGQTYEASWDPLSAVMAQHHLKAWAGVGHCTATLAQAARRQK